MELPVSINIAPDHLLSPDFVSQLKSLLDAYEVARPQNIVLEIRETSRIADFKRMRDRVVECRALGVQTALDDFGTGYSSMTYMRQLPVDELKIDKSFVMAMMESAEDRNIVRGIIALAHAFHRTVVAEGVATRQHMLELRGMGCDIAQGFAIARPMPAKEVTGWVNAWQFNFAPQPRL